MSYTIYETDAIVLSLVHAGERGLSVSLLSRDLGFIWVYAEGVRTSTSKMRAHLTRYSHVSVSLVRGRVGWRLVGVRTNESFTSLFTSTARGALAARTMQLYGRLVPDEATGLERVYDDLIAGLRLLENTSFTDLEGIEVLLVVRALAALGYLPQDEHIDHLLCGDCSLGVLVPEAQRVRAHAIPVINRVLADSHL